jgi:hypothetical protein
MSSEARAGASACAGLLSTGRDRTGYMKLMQSLRWSLPSIGLTGALAAVTVRAQALWLLAA